MEEVVAALGIVLSILLIIAALKALAVTAAAWGFSFVLIGVCSILVALDRVRRARTPALLESFFVLAPDSSKPDTFRWEVVHSRIDRHLALWPLRALLVSAGLLGLWFTLGRFLGFANHPFSSFLRVVVAISAVIAAAETGARLTRGAFRQYAERIALGANVAAAEFQEVRQLQLAVIATARELNASDDTMRALDLSRLILPYQQDILLHREKVAAAFSSLREELEALRVALESCGSARGSAQRALEGARPRVVRSNSVTLVGQLDELTLSLDATNFDDLLAKQDWEHFRLAMQGIEESAETLGDLGERFGSDQSQTRHEGSAPGPQALQDAYDTLGVDPGADFESVKLRYRALRKRYHPDAQQTSGEKRRCTLLTQQINRAWETIVRQRGTAEVLGGPNKAS